MKFEIDDMLKRKTVPLDDLSVLISYFYEHFWIFCSSY